jgi:fermentation-respiration switch protein FrsA (DUF1100 family)
VSDAREWTDRRVADGGVVERSFQLRRSGGPVPGVLWLPPSPASPRQLVLLGHGGSGHKRSTRNTPTLFHVQWDDEIFPRDGQLALFDILGSPDKELTAHVGAHADTKPRPSSAGVTSWLATWRPLAEPME